MRRSSSQLNTRRRLKRKFDNSDDTKGRKKTAMEGNGGREAAERRRFPLSEVVSDCINSWFQDTLKEAKTGDVNMQVLVAQKYYNGYGVRKDAIKGRYWVAHASRKRPSVWKVSDKRPGYNASESDTDESDGDS